MGDTFGSLCCLKETTSILLTPENAMSDSTTEADVQELKDRLEAYLQQAEAGRTITITRHGEPVVRLSPAREKRIEEQTSLRKKMQTLQDAGLAEWSGKKPPSRVPTVEVKGDQMVSEMLLEDRR